MRNHWRSYFFQPNVYTIISIIQPHFGGCQHYDLGAVGFFLAEYLQTQNICNVPFRLWTVKFVLTNFSLIALLSLFNHSRSGRSCLKNISLSPALCVYLANSEDMMWLIVINNYVLQKLASSLRSAVYLIELASLNLILRSSTHQN